MEPHRPLSDVTNTIVGCVQARLILVISFVSNDSVHLSFLCSGISAVDLRRQRDRDRYARLTDEQKAQRNAKRRENYARKKAGMSEQARLATGDPKYDEVATTVPASGACCLYQINI